MRGDRFKKRLPRFIGKIPDFDDLFQAEDKEFERIDETVEDFIFGLAIDTIRKSKTPNPWLEKLEKDYNLPAIGSVEDRINAILDKKNAQRTTTERVILEICERYGHKTRYIPQYDAYAFELEISDQLHLDRRALKGIELVKPAHLGIMVRFVLKQKIYYGMYAHKYAHKISQPYRPEDRRENQNIFFGAYQTRRVIKRRAILPDVWTTDSLGYPLEVTGEGERLEYGDK